MKLYKAHILKGILEEFIEVGDWSEYIDDSQTIDSAFSLYADLSLKVSTAFANTPVSKNEVLEEAKLMLEVLEKKISIMKMLALKEVLGGNVEGAEELCEQIMASSIKVKDLDMLITKVLVSTDV